MAKYVTQKLVHQYLTEVKGFSPKDIVYEKNDDSVDANIHSVFDDVHLRAFYEFHDFCVYTEGMYQRIEIYGAESAKWIRFLYSVYGEEYREAVHAAGEKERFNAIERAIGILKD